LPLKNKNILNKNFAGEFYCKEKKMLTELFFKKTRRAARIMVGFYFEGFTRNVFIAVLAQLC